MNYGDSSTNYNKALHNNNTLSHSYSGGAHSHHSHRSRGGSKNSHKNVAAHSSKDKLDGKKIVKMAKFYFNNHPTCLKAPSISDDSSESNNEIKNKKAIAYAKLHLTTESSEGSRKRKKYFVRNPYHEDRDSYNLDACIKERRKPNFGYPLPNLEFEDGQKPKDDEVGFEFDFLLPSVIAM